jgi:alpha-tubulin suppressor-like RCC1 family protein
VPVDVELPLAATSIGAGSQHACAVLVDGSVSCWGRNDEHELGDGSSYSSPSPVSTLGVSGAVRVDAGMAHTCALLTNGYVLCWGSNAVGQVGAGTTATVLDATSVAIIDDATAIDIGSQHSCALREGGYPVCWGDNAFGQLGTGNFDSESAPVSVSGYPTGGVSRVLASGAHSCALGFDGTLSCWGTNTDGELGIGSRYPTNAPTPVTRPGAPPQAGSVVCWGNNTQSQGGSMLGQDLLVPRVVSAVPAVAVAAGGAHSCALDATGGVRCWGDNTYGQLGDTALLPSHIPAIVGAVDNAIGLVAGSNHNCVVLESGAVECWGDNTYLQLGTELATTSGPQPIEGLALPVTALAAGHGHNCALLSDQTVACWGDDSFAQLGIGTRGSPRSTPSVIPGLSRVRAIAAGAYHSCAVDQDGRVFCWGDNLSLQIGHPTLTVSAQPVLLEGLDNVVGIGAGEQHTCAVSANGTVFCFGTGLAGALGGSTNMSAAPLEVANLSGVVTLDLSGSYSLGTEAAEGASSCALAYDGTVSCWGASVGGQLGDGSFYGQSASPVFALLP